MEAGNIQKIRVFIKNPFVFTGVHRYFEGVEPHIPLQVWARLNARALSSYDFTSRISVRYNGDTAFTGYGKDNNWIPATLESMILARKTRGLNH